jgi:hypothetical protein
MAFEAVQSHTTRDLHPVSVISFEQNRTCEVNCDRTETTGRAYGRSDPGLQTEEVTVLKFEGQQMRWRRKFKIWLDDVR